MRMTQQNSPSIIQSFSLPLPSHTRTHTYEIMRLSIIPEGQLFECLGQCSSTKYKNSLFLSQDEIAEKCIIEKLQSIFCQNVLHVTNYTLISSKLFNFVNHTGFLFKSWVHLVVYFVKMLFFALIILNHRLIRH